MAYRQKLSSSQAAAKAGISRASAYRIENNPTAPSQKKVPRGSRRPDPLAGIFDEGVNFDPQERTADSTGGGF